MQLHIYIAQESGTTYLDDDEIIVKPGMIAVRLHIHNWKFCTDECLEGKLTQVSWGEA